jgi:hypothetical protein
MESYEKSVAELIDRYVYAVTKYLPQAQRADIEKELRGLIDDMLADRTKGAAPRKEDVEAVLKELGRPSALAAKYRGEEQHLIGPEYFDLYLMIMKIVVTVAVCATAFAMIIGYIVAPPINVFQAFGQFLASVFSAAINAFAVVTFIFAVIERFAKRDEKLNDWKPSDLPPVPAAKAVIHRADPIVGMVFAVFGIIIFNVAPWLFGATGDITGKTFIPVFNLDVLKSLLPLINVMFCVGLLKEVARLVIGRYDFKLAIAVTIFNIASLILFLYIFAPPAIWNADFMTSLSTAYHWEWTATPEAAHVWSIIPKVIIGLTIFGMVVDTIQVAVRSFRHSDVKQAA